MCVDPGVAFGVIGVAVFCTVSNACLPVAGILQVAPFIFAPLGGRTASVMPVAWPAASLRP